MKRFLAIALLSLTALTARAADLPPDQLVKQTANEVIQIIKQEGIANDRNKLLDLVDAKVLPHFDFNRMTQLAVGRPWREATPEQKQSLVREFRTLLVRTYSSAMKTYKDQKLEVKPMTVAPSDTEVIVKSEVIQPGGKPIPIDYRMWKSPTGWKAFDVVVEGVSLVTNYRSQFADEVTRGGINGLVASLQKRNASPEPEKPAPVKAGAR